VEAHEKAASELLRAIRGDRSQVALARRLGYRGNPITDWENGRRYPTAEETLRACERVGIDVGAAFSRFHPAAPLLEGNVPEWLDAVRGSRSIVALAEATGSSRFAVSRWLKGAARPRLPDFLRLVDAIGGRAPELVSELVPIEQVPTFASRFETARAARDLAGEEPWSEAILRILETVPYAESRTTADADIAAHLGVNPETVNRCLRRLRDAGIIRRRGGRYHVVGELNVDTRAHSDGQRKLREHWAGVVADRCTNMREGETFGYNVMSLSEDDAAEVREVLRRAYREIRSLVAASESRETVAFMSMSLLRLTNPNRETTSSD